MGHQLLNARDLQPRCGDCSMAKYPVCACQVDRTLRGSPDLESRSRFYSSTLAGWPARKPRIVIDSIRMAAPVWPAAVPDGRIRVGLAMPLIYLGGVEVWADTLAGRMDPARFVWAGAASEAREIDDPAFALQLQRRGPVRYGPGALAALAGACDVLIVWGTTPPPRPRTCKVVLVAHGEGEWTRQRMRHAGSADVLAAVSEAARGTFPAEFRDRVQVIPNCVDLDRLEPRWSRTGTRIYWGVPPDAKVALYLGRISHEKRPEAFIDMIAALPEPWVGVMVGTGQPEAIGPDRVHAEAVAPGRIRFPGPTEDVGGVLRAADVGVVPSEQEGCCLAMLEMMACGLPVVATPVGHAQELGRLITLAGPMAEGPELAQAVRATLSNPDLDQRLRDAAAHVRRVHGAEAFGQAWSDLIARAVTPAGVADVGDGVFVTDADHCAAVVGDFDLSIHIWRPENLPGGTCARVRTGSGPGLTVEYREYDRLKAMRPALAEVITYMRRPGRLLIHCQAGQARGPTLAMLARIVRGANPETAIAEVRARNLADRKVQTDLPLEVLDDIRTTARQADKPRVPLGSA